MTTPISILTALRNRAGQFVGSTDAHPQPVSDWPVTTQVLQYWEGLRQGAPVPGRAQIDPAALAGVLEHLFLAELVAPGVARLRLAGQKLTELLGMEPRGMPLSIFLDAGGRLELDQALRQMTTGVRVVLPLRAETGLGQPGLDGQLALMPLTETEGRITRLLGVLETCGVVGRVPRRFRLAAPPRPMDQPDAVVGRRAGRFTVIEGGRV